MAGVNVLSKTEAAYLQLKNDLISNKLVAGAALRIDWLQSVYELGTTPLREALARLESEKFVELRPNRGFYAATLTAEDFADLIYSRHTLEQALLQRVIERGDDAWESRVITSYHFLKRCKADPTNLDLGLLTEWNERHTAFHLALLEGAGADRLLGFYRSVFDHLRRHQMGLMILPALSLARSGDREGIQFLEMLRNGMAIGNHTALMEATLARDTARALQLAEDHVQLTPYQITNPA